MMPDATGKPGFRGQFDIGQHADADHDEIGRNMPAVAEADAGDLVAVGLDRGRLHAEMNADAGRGVARSGNTRRFPR